MQEEPKNEESKEEQPIAEEVSWDKPDYTFIPKGNHLWRQEGYYLICSSCDLVHATFIGGDRILVGIENGEPILKTRKEVGMV